MVALQTCTAVAAGDAVRCLAWGLVLSLASTSVSQAQATYHAAVPTTPCRDTVVVWHELRSNMGELRGKLPQLLKARIDSARAEGRTLFIEIGATWCGPCLELERQLTTPEMIDAFAGTSIVHLDANEWDLDKDILPLGIHGGVLPLLVALDTAMTVTSQLNGVIDAPQLKQFLQAHRWPDPQHAAPHAKPVIHSAAKKQKH